MQYNYSDELKAAFVFTEQLGLKAPEYLPIPDRVLSNNSDTLSNALQKSLGHLSPDQVSAQCFAINFKLRSEVDRALNTSSLLTFGWVHEPPNDYFKMSASDLRQLVRQPKAMNSLNLHCWLTLPSEEIIDVTLPTTQGYVLKRPEQYGLVLSKHWTEFTGGVRFHPLVVGEDFLLKSGVFHFLAFHL